MKTKKTKIEEKLQIYKTYIEYLILIGTTYIWTKFGSKYDLISFFGFIALATIINLTIVGILSLVKDKYE